MYFIMKKIYDDLSKYIKIVLFSSKWRKLNRHNFTRAETIFPIRNVSVGNGSYGGLNIRAWNNPDCKLKIGSYCSIAPRVVFLLSGEHYLKSFSSYPFNTFYLKMTEYKGISKGDIIIEDDVWIGEGATILSGVRIGQGAVIGAKSIVTKDIPAYAIYAGNKVIRYRFNEVIRKKLIKFDFSKLSKNEIEKNKKLLYLDIDELFFESEIYRNCVRKNEI